MAITSPESSISISSTRELQQLLVGHDIPVAKWGVAPAKSIEDLWEELVAKESSLEIVRGVIARVIHVICADVYYHDRAGRSYRLQEEEQIYFTGARKKRTHAHAISEKVQQGESLLEALRRGLREELKIMDGAVIADFGVEVEEQYSKRYPELLTKYFCHRFLVVLEGKDFCPDGYLEVQKEKINYFTWAPFEVVSETL